MHRRTMRRGLAARHQRRRRAAPLHPGGELGVRDLQQDRHAARGVHRGQPVAGHEPAAVRRQQSGRSDRRLRPARRSLDPVALRVLERSGAVLSVHRGIEDERSRRRRLVALRGPHGSGRNGTAAERLSRRLSEVRRLARLSLPRCERVPRLRSLSRRRLRHVQPRRHVQRRAADVRAGLRARIEQHRQHVSEHRRRQGPERGGSRDTELLRERVANRVQLRSPKAHCGPELRRRRHARRGDDRQPDRVSVRELRNGGSATEYRAGARQHRRPHHAEGAVPAHRQHRVAVDHAQRRHRVRDDGDAMGADRRHRRHGRHDAGAAADLRARHDALSLDGQPRRRRTGQHGSRLQHVERQPARTSRASRMPADSRPTRSPRCRERRCSWSQAADRRRSTSAGAITAR